MDDRLFSMYEKQLQKAGSRLREEIAQELFGIRISLQRFILARGHEENLTPLKGMIDDAIRHVSEVANELHPIILAQIGFLQAVDELIYQHFPPQTQIRSHIDRRIQTKTHYFQLNCYRILQELFTYLALIPSPDTLNLKLIVNDREVRITLDGFLNLDTQEDEKKSFDKEIRSLLDSRVTLHSGSIEMKFSKRRSLLSIYIFSS